MSSSLRGFLRRSARLPFKVLAALAAAGLSVPVGVTTDWVVDCKGVGNGEKALVYLGRYLYRGVNLKDYDFYAWAVRPGDVAAFPEADTWAMLLAGLGLVGVAARWRRG